MWRSFVFSQEILTELLQMETPFDQSMFKRVSFFYRDPFHVKKNFSQALREARLVRDWLNDPTEKSRLLAYPHFCSIPVRGSSSSLLVASKHVVARCDLCIKLRATRLARFIALQSAEREGLPELTYTLINSHSLTLTLSRTEPENFWRG